MSRNLSAPAAFTNRPFPPNINSRTFYCPQATCRRELGLKFAKGGVHAQSYYLHITHHGLQCDSMAHTKHFWFFFPHDQTPLSHRPTLPPTAPTTRKHPIIDCGLPGCKSRANHRCENKQCKAHCTAAGGCYYSRHRLPPPESTTAFDGPFLEEALVQISQLHPSIPQPTAMPCTPDRELRANHPLWFLSPSPSPQRSSSSHNPVPPSPALAGPFFLVDFRENAQPAVENEILDHFPYWMHPGTEAYQCYSVEYSTWMTVKASYVHDLRKTPRILIRAIGVTGSDEASQVRRLHTMTTATERTLILPSSSTTSSNSAPKGKKRKTVESGDDDDIVIVRFQRAIKQEPETPPSKRRPALAVRIPSSPPSSTPSLSASSSAGPSTSLVPSPTSSPEFPTSLLTANRFPVWKI
ncbi:hypothetical protein B0H19DRAFT_1070262 [Mycena capillaripes]|nr:hypothetical protein B0H19DRAFT_1070262 [Mycena capillaripes]